jgi:hypothetical protein
MQAETEPPALHLKPFPADTFTPQPARADAKDAAVETLAWAPLVVAGPDGRANVDLPRSDRQPAIQLAIDAHADGRIGSVIFRGADCQSASNGRPLGNLPGGTGPTSGATGILPVPNPDRTPPPGPDKTVADGPLRRISLSGWMAGPERLSVRLPQQCVKDSIEATLYLFPSVLADADRGIAGIEAESHGTFDDRASLTQASVLALRFVEQHDGVDPATLRRLKGLVAAGVRGLCNCETKTGGLASAGAAADEVLTATGLMTLREAAAVSQVDPAVVRRLGQWLLGRRDGKGGFLHAKPIQGDAAAAELADAYIVWTLAACGQRNIDAELDHAIELAAKSNQPCRIALAAAAAADSGRHDAAARLLERLAKLLSDDGHLEAREPTVFSSAALPAQAEATALAAIAWLKQPAFARQAQRAVDWLWKNRQGSGSFGSAPATALALRALAAHAPTGRKPVAEGQIAVICDNVLLGQRSLAAGQEQGVSLTGLGPHLKPGENPIALSLTGDSQMPYLLDVTFRAREREKGK